MTWPSWLTGKFPSTVSRLKQCALNIEQWWCRAKKLSLSPDNMELAPCTKKAGEFMEPTMLNTLLHTTESKTLEAIPDATLTWRANVKQGISKAHPSFWLTGHLGWRLSPGVKQLRREAHHSPPSSAKVMNDGTIPPLPHTSSWCDSFTFYPSHRTLCKAWMLKPKIVQWLYKV
jgi:hypothetical protein